MSKTVKIHIDMDKKCAECGKGGAVQNGLCMSCTTKSLDENWQPKSEAARHVQMCAGLNQIKERYEAQIEKLDERQLQNIKARQRERKMGRAKKGHNADAVTSPDRLRSFIKRIEYVEEQQAALADDKKEIYAEAKGTGYDTAVIRAIISRRKKEPQKLREFEDIFDLYWSAIGDLAGTPLGNAGAPKGAQP